MYGAVDTHISPSPPPSPPIVDAAMQFKVYRRRWLYLICICLANMSNAIVRRTLLPQLKHGPALCLVMDQLCVHREFGQELLRCFLLIDQLALAGVHGRLQRVHITIDVGDRSLRHSIRSKRARLRAPRRLNFE